MLSKVIVILLALSLGSRLHAQAPTSMGGINQMWFNLNAGPAVSKNLLGFGTGGGLSPIIQKAQ